MSAAPTQFAMEHLPVPIVLHERSDQHHSLTSTLVTHELHDASGVGLGAGDGVGGGVGGGGVGGAVPWQSLSVIGTGLMPPFFWHAPTAPSGHGHRNEFWPPST
jgi:hypothetical protein